MKTFVPMPALTGLDFGADPTGLREKYAALRDREIRRYLEAPDEDGSAYRAGQFIKATINGDPRASRWCRDKSLTIVKAQATNTNLAGGVLLPEEVANDVLLLAESFGFIRREAMHWPMTSEVDKVPRSITNFKAAWIAEGLAPAGVQAAFDAVSLTAKKLGAFTTVSSELLEDSSTRLGKYFLVGAAQAFAEAEDLAAIVGDGTSVYGGARGLQTILSDGAHAAGKIIAAGGHDTYATLDGADLGALIAALPARAFKTGNVKIACSATAYAWTFVRLAATSGGLVASHDADGKLRASWQGIPIEISSAFSTSTSSISGELMLGAGDFAQGIAFGSRRDLTIQRFPERYAELDQVLVRMTERCVPVVHDVGDNDAAGAVVGLFAP